MTEIVNLKISKLKLLEKNPRKIDKIQFEKLCKSLQDDPQFLQNRPILVHKQDNQMLVYAGNQRVRAAKKLGWKEIPCIIEDNLTEEIIKKRTVLDNVSFGEFDFDILSSDYEIDMLFDCGFTAKDLELDTSPIKEIKEDESNSETDTEKGNTCPNCGHKF